MTMTDACNDICICKTESRLLNLDNPWIKYYIVSEFAGFPKDIANIISDYLSELKLLDWIDLGALDQNCLEFNPNALLAGLIPDLENTSPYIAANPLAFDYIKANIDEYISSEYKWRNPPMVEWLFSVGIYPKKSSYFQLGFCESKLAIQWILDNVQKQKAIDYLTCNPMAIDILRQNLDMIDDKIWGNCAAIDILQSKITAGDEINWIWLSYNRSPWAIDLLQRNQDEIYWKYFAENPSIFEVTDHPEKNRLMEILVRK